MKKYIVVKGSGGAGLGDKIFGLAVGILLARETGRTLHVDWRDRAYQSGAENLFPLLFRLSGIETTSNLPLVDAVDPPVWNGRMELSLDDLRSADLAERGITWQGAAPKWDREEALRRYSCDVTSEDTKKEVLVVWSGGSMRKLNDRVNRNDGPKNSLTESQRYREVLQNHLHFDFEVLEAITSKWQEMFADQTVIGVHYRKTDEAAAVRSVPTEKLYFKATDRVVSELGVGGEASIFLATDNASVIDRYTSRYGKDTVRWNQKWMPEPGQSIHKNSACPDGLMAAKEALIDIGLLARCDQLILTGNSAFSLLVQWMSGLDEPRVRLLYPNQSLKRRLLSLIRGTK